MQYLSVELYVNKSLRKYIFVYDVRKCSSFIPLQVVDQFWERNFMCGQAKSGMDSFGFK